MIYLSAQPDDLYFLWQLEVMINNFKRIGIPSKSIHVLLGYKPQAGLRPEFQRMVKSNKDATFFCYPDQRTNQLYVSSIRPHIIEQHFRALNNLERETIFYHDSDIIFREKLDEAKLSADNQIFLSNTDGYFSFKSITKYTKEHLLKGMSKIVNVDYTLVSKSKLNFGGAQYVLKEVNSMFWSKVEKDCNDIFLYLSNYAKQYKVDDKNLTWCADMWSILLNLILINKRLNTINELDFCWPKDDISCWYKTKIFHNAGVIGSMSDYLFCKGGYTKATPYFNNFSYVDSQTCSSKYIEEIEVYQKNKPKIDLTDVTFIIPVRIDSEDRKINLDLTIRFITKYFTTNIILIEADNVQKVKEEILHPGVTYTYIEDSKKKYHRTKYLNIGIKNAKTNIVAIYDIDVIVPPTQFVEAVQRIRDQRFVIAYPFDGRFVCLKREITLEFEKHLDCSIMDQSYASAISENSYGGCCIVDRKSYILAGMENENFKSWGRDDIERAKRMQILGHQIYRVPGSLFHLDHYRGAGSNQLNYYYNRANDLEYIKVCNFTRDDLINYINTWQWVKDYGTNC